MKTRLTRIFVGLLLVLMFPLGLLLNPVSAQAATKKPVVTKLETSPSKPQGLNGWYTSVVMVELDSDSDTTTYFQINTTAGEWQKYTQPFRAWRGQNTIYYYSVNTHGIKEDIRSKVIKVDYLKPTVQSLKSESKNGGVEISWVKQSDVVYSKIYRINNHEYDLIGTAVENSFADKTAKIGKTYVYAVVAKDQAGLKSKKNLTSLTVMASLAGTVSPSTVSLSTVSRETQLIGKGASAVSSSQKPKIETEVKTETPATEATKPENKPVRNWNRLFIAISILVIAGLIAVASYYLYEWRAKSTEVQDKPKEKKSNNSRW